MYQRITWVACFFAITMFAFLGANAAAAESGPEYRVVYSADSQCGYPDWSPDGQSLVITAGGGPDEEGDLWIVPLDDTEAWQLTTGGGHHGVFSPDGHLIVYDGGRGSVVRVVPAAGGTAIRVVPEEIPIERSANPCWSPDGSQIIFRVENGLHSLELATGVIEPVFEAQGMIPMPIHWLDSGEVLAAMINQEDRTAELYRIPLDGGDPVQITGCGRTTQATVSPDQSLIVYSAQIEGEESGLDLWAVSIGGGEPVRLVGDADSHDMEPCWSPSGDELAYVRYDGETFEVVVIPVSRNVILAKLAAAVHL